MAEPKITKELLQKAMACETPEEFIELAPRRRTSNSTALT